MHKEKIIIEIDVDGSTKVSVEGVKGKGCEALTKDIEESLGSVTERKHTPEFSQRETQSERAVQR
jgi:hypothetical protein